MEARRANSYRAVGDLRPFIALLTAKRRMAAPVEKDGRLDFAFVDDPGLVAIDDRPTFKSAKEFVFPRVEEVLVLGPDGARQVEPEGETVVFGVRPCDLAGLRVMKSVFLNGKYADPFFEARMSRTVVIGLGCESMKPGCFCDERGIALDRSEDCDIFVSQDMKEGRGSYLLRAFTDRGELILEEAARSGVLAETPAVQDRAGGAAARGAAEDSAGRVESGARSGASEAKLKPELSLPESDEKRVFDLKTWDLAAETCVGCGTCTFICPTCHCFAFRDIRRGEETTRYRLWDSCMFPRFTMHASGHNPRATKRERYRQRVMHKFLYVPANFGLVACVGCGRCIRSCPAGVSIRDIVKEAAAELRALRERQGEKA